MASGRLAVRQRGEGRVWYNYEVLRVSMVTDHHSGIDQAED